MASDTIKCKWTAHDLNDKTVEFATHREGKRIAGKGFFSAVESLDGSMNLSILIPTPAGKELKIILSQAEADHIESHTESREFRFRCIVQP